MFFKWFYVIRILTNISLYAEILYIPNLIVDLKIA